MTYREWFKATCEDFDMSDAKIDVIMVNQNINPDEDVEPKRAKKALCAEFATLIPMIASKSEGGYSVSYNLEAIKSWYRITCAELGKADATKPRVRNKSNIW